MPAPSAVFPNKAELFSQYQILEDLGDFPNYSLFKVKAPNGSIKLWKKIDLQFSSASIETRLLPVIEKVSHPNLNAISGSFLFQDKGLLFVESEFPFKTLRHRLEEVGGNKQGSKNPTGIPISELFTYMAMTAEAIDYLNTPQHPYQGKKIAIYHRALSPDSLHLFEDKGKIICKLGDFGLAKPIVDSNDSARHSLGLTNYDYAPPEFDEGMTTSTSDQYSFATTYCELRTGRLPFTGSLLQKLQAQLSGNPDLSLLEPNERPVVARALNRDPHARFPSCREFIKQLQAALGGVVTVHIPTSAAGGRTAAPVSAMGDSLFGSGNSGWALSARPVGRSGGALFNVSAKEPVNAPAKADGLSKSPPTTLASASAASVPAPIPAAVPKVPAVPKPRENKQQPSTSKAVTPPQSEGWSVETPNETVTSPAVNNNWEPGKVTGGSSSGEKKPAEKKSAKKEPVIVEDPITPPPPPVRPEPMSNKARETLNLIKRNQAAGAAQNATPTTGMENPAAGSKFLSGGSSTQHPVAPPAGRQPPPLTGNRFGALNETPAPPRHAMSDARRASTPNMGVALPARNAPAPSAHHPVHWVLPRRQSSGVAQVARASSSPLDVRQAMAPDAPRERFSIMTMVMIAILAFCIGMFVLFYFTKK